MTLSCLAPAKINLTLHVTGRRADGYHELDSLVVFTALGDRVRADHAGHLSLSVSGPCRDDVPPGPENLVLRAARAMGVERAALVLVKHLPVASGIGGGSSDAAAALRVLASLTGRPLPPAHVQLTLGGDVPVCVRARPARMRGIGEVLDDTPPLPAFSLVLANPGIQCSTAEIFSRLASRSNPPMPACLPTWATAQQFTAWLAGMRNDLQEPACALYPEITATLAALRAQPGCLAARMSGSGATCFGVFASDAASSDAAAAVTRLQPGWWVRATPLLMPGAIAPEAVTTPLA